MNQWTQLTNWDASQARFGVLVLSVSQMQDIQQVMGYNQRNRHAQTDKEMGCSKEPKSTFVNSCATQFVKYEYYYHFTDRNVTMLG